MEASDRPVRVLVVEDDQEIAQVLQRSLRMEGYDVKVTDDGAKALDETQAFLPDLIVLDLGLPGMDGIEVARTLRRDEDDTPILILTARDALDSRVEGLDVGADDYLVKPFGKAELLARIAAVMRRVDRSTAGPATGPVSVGALVLEPARHEARVGAQALTLTPTEFRLLEALVRAAGDIVPHHLLARSGWPAETDPDLLLLKPHLARLRAKVESAGGPQILAVRGVGYRIEANEQG
jgi:DNA-binding response OmpR family regulator